MAAAADNATDRVAVRCWQARYLVPAGHPTPERVRQRLDSVLRSEVMRPLSAQLQRIINPGDPALVLVRRLAFDVAVDAGWSLDDIGAQCARALAITLSRELAAADPTNIVRFANRSEHLARFLVDTATGLAASRWYYASFAGLAALPAGAAIRTALIADVYAGVGALRTLDDGSLAKVLAALGARECEQLCEALRHASAPGDPPRALECLVAAWREHPPPAHLNAGPLVAVWLLGRLTTPVNRDLVMLARTCGAIAVALARGQLNFASLNDMLDSGGVTSDDRLAGLPAESLTALRSCPRTLLRELLARHESPTGVSAPGVEFLGSTTFGGAFLLLDDLFALNLEELTVGWPEAMTTAPARALGLLILGCSCLGAEAPALFADPLWRRLFGIDPALTFAALAAWLETLGLKRRHALVRAPSKQRRRGRGVRHAPMRGAASTDDQVALSPPAPISAGWSRAMSSLAYQLLRNFAQRIPGYAASHARYLQHNFLSAPASIAADTTRIVVRLGRPPLALMLNLAGLNRGTRAWPSLDERPFALFTEECL